MIPLRAALYFRVRSSIALQSTEGRSAGSANLSVAWPNLSISESEVKVADGKKLQKSASREQRTQLTQLVIVGVRILELAITILHDLLSRGGPWWPTI